MACYGVTFTFFFTIFFFRFYAWVLVALNTFETACEMMSFVTLVWTVSLSLCSNSVYVGPSSNEDMFVPNCARHAAYFDTVHLTGRTRGGVLYI